jgi:peptidoglycan-associated lipoprotein
VKTCKVLKVVVFLTMTALLMAGCKNNPFMRKQDAMAGAPLNGSNFGAPPISGPGGIESSVLPEPIRGGRQAVETGDMKRIYFTFDSASLLDPAKAQLDENAAFLRSNPNLVIQIEGHCDARGTSDYNYALGQRRADVARDYLIQQGIAPQRLHTISYGADRPDDPGSNDLAHARNRRSQFLIYQ